ncbi:MAG: autotransporter-associated beta strand repeat-containing protein, partial [Anaerolineae bacterium]|nr:autotransporter-associated beta strand repeat-containing protein [Anaerolineae bacterium]
IGGGGGTLFFTQKITGPINLEIGPKGGGLGANNGFGGTVYLTNANDHTGLTLVRNSITLFLSNLTGNAMGGNLQIGDTATAIGTSRAQPSALVRLGAPDQIPDTATVTFDATSAQFAYLILMGNNETVGGINDETGYGFIENREGDAINASSILTVNNNIDNVFYGYFRDFNGGIAPAGGVYPTIGLTKDGTGMLTLAGGNIGYTGPTWIKNGTLKLSDWGVVGIITNDSSLILDVFARGYSSLVQPVVGMGSVTKTGPETLRLDFSGVNNYGGAIPSNILNQAVPLTIAGGQVMAVGPAYGGATQNFSVVNIQPGFQMLTATNGPLGGYMEVNVGAFNRAPNAGAMLAVNASGNAVVSGAPANDATGIIGPWAVYADNDWAANNGAGRFTNYTGYVGLSGWGAGANVSVTNYGFIIGDAAVNTLRF